MLNDFFDKEEKIITCHEQLQLAHKKNFVKILKQKEIPFDPKTLKLKEDQPKKSQPSVEEEKKEQVV